MAWIDDLQFDLDLNQDLLNTQLSTQNLLDNNQRKLNFGLGLKNNLGNLAGVLSGIASGPVGWAGLAIKALGDNISAARAQFDYNSYADAMSKSASDFLNSAGSANTTSDLLGLNSQMVNFTDDINNQGYKWDGNILSGIGAIIGNAKTEKAKQRAREYQASLNNQYTLGINNAQNRVSTNTYRQGMANFLNNAAMGGPLSTHGSDFSDGLIRIDAGGTHEQNPLGGVPAGVDPQGIPNLVEEGETIWDDYVFSKRLKAPKALVKKYGLGGGKKAMSYSEAARKASEKSGADLRPNDSISKRTKEAILTELEESQEEKRIAKEQKDMIKAMSEMSPEEFEALFTQQPSVPQAPIEGQIPPQGVNEGMPVEEPLMQEPVGYEPTGLQGFALGGHILDGEHGESRRTVSSLAGPQRLQGAGIIANTITMHKTSTGRTYYMVNGERYQTLAGAQDAVIKSQRAAEDKRLEDATKGITPATVTGSYADALRFKNITERNAFETQKAVEDALRAGEEYLSEKTAEDYADRVSRIGAMKKAGYQGFRQVDENGVPTGYSPWNFGDSAMRSAFINRLNNGIYTDLTSPGAYFTPEAVVYGERQTPNELPVDEPHPGSGSGSGSITNSPSTAWTPKKIFSASRISPSDMWRQRSIMFNPKPPRTAVQKAVESTTETDPENTVSVGAQQNRMLPTWMRYAPIVGGGLSVLSDLFSRPDYSGYENLLADSRRLSSPVNIPVQTIGNRMRRNPFDERLSVNQANQNLAAGLRSTRDNAGGNRAYRQFANSLMAYNNQAQLSDIARNAYLASRQDAFQTGEFNRGTDMYNASAINQRNIAQAQLNSGRGYQGYMARANAINALENARRYDDQMASADLTSFMQSLHNVGNENEWRNWLTSLGDEGVLNYLMGRNGRITFSPDTSAKCGGKIKTKKRRF